MAEELEVIARARDELTRPVERMTDSVDELGRAGARADRGLRRGAGGAGKLGQSLRILNRGALDVGRGLGRMANLAGRGLAVGFGAGVVAVGAAGAAVTAFVGNGVRDLANLGRIEAQTNAVLESTGGIANVTGDEVARMAEKLERVTGAEQEAIREGANLLLTFTNVRNAAGKGNDVFDQATKLGLDMATALGTDAKSAALQLGKALNDPTKGVTKLARAGVQFTDEQVATIKALQESGDLLGAQKVILGELETQFGGSAKAAGSTFAGQMAKARNAIGDVGEGIAGGLMPELDKLGGPGLKTLRRLARQSEGFGEALGRGVRKGIKVLGRLPDVFADAGGGVEGIRAVLGELLPPSFADLIGDVVTVVGDLFGAFAQGKALLPAILSPFELLRSVLGWLADNGDVVRAFATTLGVLVGAVGAWTLAQWALNAALTANPVGIIVVAIAALVAGLVAAYNRSETFRNIVQAVGAVLAAAWDVLKPVVAAFGRFAIAVAKVALKVGVFVAKWSPLGIAIRLGARLVGNLVERFGGWEGIMARVKAGIERARPVFEGIGDVIRSIVDAVTSAVEWFGRLIDKVDSIGGGVFDAVSGFFGGARAEGGPTRAGGAYLVGERGPELHVPSRSGWVVPNHELAALAAKVTGAAGGDGGSYHAGDRYDVRVDARGSSSSPEDLERAVYRALKKAQRDKAERTVGRGR